MNPDILLRPIPVFHNPQRCLPPCLLGFALFMPIKNHAFVGPTFILHLKLRLANRGAYGLTEWASTFRLHLALLLPFHIIPLLPHAPFPHLVHHRLSLHPRKTNEASGNQRRNRLAL